MVARLSLFPRIVTVKLKFPNPHCQGVENWHFGFFRFVGAFQFINNSQCFCSFRSRSSESASSSPSSSESEGSGEVGEEGLEGGESSVEEDDEEVEEGDEAEVAVEGDEDEEENPEEEDEEEEEDSQMEESSGSEVDIDEAETSGDIEDGVALDIGDEMRGGSSSARAAIMGLDTSWMEDAISVGSGNEDLFAEMVTLC